jgi:hypothetical protein
MTKGDQTTSKDEQITTTNHKPGPDNQEKTLPIAKPPKMLTKTEKSARKKAPPRSRTELKRRAKIIVKAMLDGKTATEACQLAGYSSKTPVTNLINSKEVQKSFQQNMEKAGLSDDFLAAKLRSLVDAKEIKFFSEKGIVTDQREIEALSIQADMLKFATKVKGHIKEETGAINNNINWSVNFNLVAKVEPDSKVIDLQPVDKELST